ncbi:MAG: ribbon-helix-helix protein, CopG family [Pseudomonadota bacterium]|nr:ribbon-helix-helix protein, CopG family [Pseudomonadota bacterium]
MARSSDAARAERTNTALKFLRQYASLAEAAKALVEVYGMSKRQAYRYLHAARTQGEPVAVPERKVAFTVKLSESLIHALRRHATLTEQSLSELVTQALEALLRRDRRRGR